jgi:exosortase
MCRSETPLAAARLTARKIECMAADRFGRLALIAGLAFAVALVCWPSSVILADKWADTVNLGYTHGWLVLGLCAALVWRSRRDIAGAASARSAWALALLAAAMLGWLVSYRASVETVELPLVAVIFWLAVAAALGWAVARVMLFPAAFFLFAVPIWDPAPLRILTVKAVHALLWLTGPPAVFTGDFVKIPNGTFVIEDGCSGVHFMIVGLAVAALYGELERDPWRMRLRQLALIAVLAVIANWIRVYTVIEAGYLTDMQSYLVRVSHYGFGWCVFAVALIVFFWLAPRPGRGTSVESGAGAGSARAASPASSREYRLRPDLIGFAGAVAVIIALPLVSELARRAHPAPPGGTLRAAMSEADPPPQWHLLTVAATSVWAPKFPGADVMRRVEFADTAGRTIEVLTVTYQVQRDGAELVGESSSLFGDQLRPRAQELINTRAGLFRETEVADRSQARSLLWWRYEVAGRALVSPSAEQLWYGVNALLWRAPAQLTALRTVCGDDCAVARGVLSEFVASGGVH